MTTIHLISNPAGRYHFVGFGIPATLCYTMEDGSPVTKAAMKIVQHVGSAIAPVKSRMFDTADEAVEAAKEFNIEVEVH